jgi:hypothetical protein
VLGEIRFESGLRILCARRVLRLVTATMFVGCLLLASCSLLVSTSGLATGDAHGADGGSNDATPDTSGPDSSIEADASPDGSAIPAGAVLWPTNNHHYLAVKGTITWTEANEAARAAGGHLATLTSLEENNFVFGLVLVADAAWFGATKPNPSQAPPSSGWTWVTGEPWAFTNWRPTQPDNASGNQDVAHFSSASAVGQWGDDAHDSTANAYVVEFE